MMIISTSVSYGGDNKIYAITNSVLTQRNTTSQIICIDGYKYLITQTEPKFNSSQSGFGVSVVQMMKDGGRSLPPQPVKCKE